METTLQFYKMFKTKLCQKTPVINEFEMAFGKFDQEKIILIKTTVVWLPLFFI